MFSSLPYQKYEEAPQSLPEGKYPSEVTSPKLSTLHRQEGEIDRGRKSVFGPVFVSEGFVSVRDFLEGIQVFLSLCVCNRIPIGPFVSIGSY